MAFAKRSVACRRPADSMRVLAPVLIVLVTMAPAWSDSKGAGDGTDAARTIAEKPVRYTRVYADVDELSHFDEQTMPLEFYDDVEGVPPFAASAWQRPTGMRFTRLPAGWFGDWHPAPQRQFVMILSGTMLIRVGDGEEREFGPGSVLLVEDTVGQGHTTRVVGDTPLEGLFMPLADDEGGKE